MNLGNFKMRNALGKVFFLSNPRDLGALFDKYNRCATVGSIKSDLNIKMNWEIFTLVANALLVGVVATRYYYTREGDELFWLGWLVVLMVWGIFASLNV